MFEIASVPAVTSYAAIALVLAGFYLLISTLGGHTAGYLRRLHKKKSPIPFEPGRFISQESQFISRHLRRRGGAALIFLASFASLLALGRQDWWPQMPQWAWFLLAGAILALLAFAQFRFLRLALYRQKLDAFHDDHVVVGDRLNEARARGYKVFNAVPMREGVIDHLIVSERGMFAIQIVSPPSRKFTSVRLENDMLVFAPNDAEKGCKKIDKYLRPVKILRNRLSRAVGHDIKVLPIIVVTNVEVEATSEPGCVLASSGNCIMFVGFNNPGAHLMDDEVKKISKWLTDRCRAQPFRKWHTRLNWEDIGYHA